MGAIDHFPFVPLIFVVVGAIIGVTGLRQSLSAGRMRSRGVRAAGVVTELRAVRSTGSRVMRHPVVLFTTADGREVQTVSPVGSQPPSHRVGQHVSLVYDPDDPSSILLGSGAGTQLGMIAIAAVGFVFAVIGVVWLLHGLGS